MRQRDPQDLPVRLPVSAAGALADYAETVDKEVIVRG
jgi:hypothetical protein